MKKQSLKKFFGFGLALALTSISSMKALACDDNLKAFPRDCQIQDRFLLLKKDLEAQNKDINQIAEYRVLRFVDRFLWEKAKMTQTPPKNIYQPAPQTWQVWSEGISNLIPKEGLKGELFQSLKINSYTIANMNYNLLQNSKYSIKDPRTDQTLKPGEFRKSTSTGVGFCSDGRTDFSSAILNSDESMNRFQQKWEQSTQSLLQNLASNQAYQAKMISYMNVSSQLCDSFNPKSNFISYAPSSIVDDEIQLITAFIQKNMDLYKTQTNTIAPIELSALIQKWFVSIHPFSDGNGRTSRAIQDIILANFDLPFVPGGDLQTDATAVAENYVEQTYTKLESLLTTLEQCKINSYTDFHCQSVEDLNNNVQLIQNDFKTSRPRVKKD